MSDDQIIKPTNVHVTGEPADIEVKNVHVTGGEDAAEAIAEKIGVKNVHVTTEPAGDAGTVTPLGNVHVTTEPAK